MLELRYVGKGGYGCYPCYEDQNGKIYFDKEYREPDEVSEDTPFSLYTGAYRHPEDKDIIGEPYDALMDEVSFNGIVFPHPDIYVSGYRAPGNVVKLLEQADKYSLKRWDKYGVVQKSPKNMLDLLLILKACGSNLDELHDVSIGNRDDVCGIYNLSGVTCDSDVAEILLSYFKVFYSQEEFRQYIEKEVLEDGETFDSYLKEYDDVINLNDTVYIIDGRC